MSDAQPGPRDPGAVAVPGDSGRSSTPPEGSPARPTSLRVAAGLMYAGAAVSVLDAVLTVVVGVRLGRDLPVEDPNSGFPNGLDTLVVGTAVAVAAVGLVTAGLWIWLAVMTGRGRPWARVVATILSGIVIAVSLSGLARPVLAVEVAADVASLVLATTILVLLWRRESSGYLAVTSGRGS